MKRFALALALATSAVALGLLTTPFSLATAQATEALKAGSFLPAGQALSYLKANQDSILIDIRSPAAVKASGMPVDAAKNIPFKLGSDKVNPNFARDVDNFMQHRKHMSVFSTIILLCQSGSCATKAIQALDDMGYDSVYTVPGEWRKHNLPWTKNVTPEKLYHVSSAASGQTLVR